MVRLPLIYNEKTMSKFELFLPWPFLYHKSAATCQIDSYKVSNSNLRYADDTVLISALIDRVEAESEKKGFLLNTRKTECILITKNQATLLLI